MEWPVLKERKQRRKCLLHAARISVTSGMPHYVAFPLNNNLIFPGHLGEGSALEKEAVMRGKVLESQTVEGVGGFIIST